MRTAHSSSEMFIPSHGAAATRSLTIWDIRALGFRLSEWLLFSGLVVEGVEGVALGFQWEVPLE